MQQESELVHFGDEDEQKYDGRCEGQNGAGPDEHELALVVIRRRFGDAYEHVQSAEELCQEVNHRDGLKRSLERFGAHARIARSSGGVSCNQRWPWKFNRQSHCSRRRLWCWKRCCTPRLRKCWSGSPRLNGGRFARWWRI